MRGRLGFAGVLAIVVALVAIPVVISVGSAAEVAGVVTEIRKAQGDVRVKPARQADWKPVRPLMSLYAGDQIRIDGNAAVVVLAAGGGAKTLTAKESPFTVLAPTAQGGGAAGKRVLADVTRVLVAKQEEPSYLRLTSRSTAAAGLAPNTPAILGPRETRVLAAPVTFSWHGSDSLRYTIEVIGPEGTVWQASDLPDKSVTYPKDARALRPGTRYQWVLRTVGYPPLRTWFEMPPSDHAARMKSELAELDPKHLPDHSASTVVVMRAGLLFHEQFYQAALDELTSAMKTYRDEPTLKFMAAHVYDQIGLKPLAAQYFEEARNLLDEKISAGTK